MIGQLLGDCVSVSPSFTYKEYKHTHLKYYLLHMKFIIIIFM